MPLGDFGFVIGLSRWGIFQCAFLAVRCMRRMTVEGLKVAKIRPPALSYKTSESKGKRLSYSGLF